MTEERPLMLGKSRSFVMGYGARAGWKRLHQGSQDVYSHMDPRAMIVDRDHDVSQFGDLAVEINLHCAPFVECRLRVRLWFSSPLSDLDFPVPHNPSTITEADRFRESSQA
jgi:hypothetical protein